MPKKSTISGPKKQTSKNIQKISKQKSKTSSNKHHQIQKQATKPNSNTNNNIKKKKLDPGKKLCKNCFCIMPIHQKVCASCGHVHEMKRNKQDIMKNLNKITPILIKNIIQKNDFNQFQPWNQNTKYSIGSLLQTQSSITNNNHVHIQINRSKSQQPSQLLQQSIKSLPRKRSSQPKSTIQSASLSSNSINSFSFKQTNNSNFIYTQLKNPVTCLASSQKWVVFIQSIKKHTNDLQNKQQMTIKAYNLQKYNLVGIDYHGQSIVHYCQISSPSSSSSQQKPKKQKRNISQHSNSQPHNFLNSCQFKQISINHHLQKIKIFSNIIIALTGLSTLIIFSLPFQKNTQQNNIKSFALHDNLQIIQCKPDRITAFQFLRTSATLKNMSINKNQASVNEGNRRNGINCVDIVVGTLYGRISVYNVCNDGYNIVRFIQNGHYQMITAISQCPINQKNNKKSSNKNNKNTNNNKDKIQQSQQSQQQQYLQITPQNHNSQSQQQQSQAQSQPQILFATGSYDGHIKIWDLHQLQPIFKYQVSNRKIWNIYWDPGTKYLFINRDQLLDPCVILCFYSINKIQANVIFSQNVQIRNVKTFKNATMCSHNYSSKSIPILDPINGMFKMLSLEELRGNSLKKKKLKRDFGNREMYRIEIDDSGQGKDNTPRIQQLNQQQQQENNVVKSKKVEKQKCQQKKLPIFSSISIQKLDNNKQFVYFTSYNGNIVVYCKNP